MDDEETWKIKVDFVESQSLSGLLIRSLDHDISSHPYSNGLSAALGNPLNVNKRTGVTVGVNQKPPRGSETVKISTVSMPTVAIPAPTGLHKSLAAMRRRKSCSIRTNVLLGQDRCKSFAA